MLLSHIYNQYKEHTIYCNVKVRKSKFVPLCELTHKILVEMGLSNEVKDKMPFLMYLGFITIAY